MEAEVGYLVHRLSLKLPEHQELASLSRRALVAFAARCANYAVPIAEHFVREAMADELAEVIRRSVTFAETYGASTTEAERPIKQLVLMAAIAKRAEQQFEKAEEQDDDMPQSTAGYYMAYAAYCATWAVDFAARIVQFTDNGISLAYEAMIYAASAYCLHEEAQFRLSGPPSKLAEENAQRTAKSISDAVVADLASLRPSPHDLYPPEVFGPLRIQVDEMPLIADWRDVRVFASSTFRDMQQERDFLRDVVFPRLGEALRPYRLRPVLVDLRWDLRSLSDVDGGRHELDILRNCFGEIERCKPYFIALIGNRYGSILSHEPVAEAICGRLPEPQPTDVSVTELEITYALQSSTHSFFYLQDQPEGQTTSSHEDPQAAKLAALRRKIVSNAPNRARCYHTEQAPDGRGHHLDALGALIFHDLYNALRSDPPPSEVAIQLPASYPGESPKEYCDESLERNGGPRTPLIIRALCDKLAEADSSKWLDAALDLLVCLDERDFVDADSTSGQWDNKVQSYALRLVASLPTCLIELYRLMIERCERRLDPTGGSVRGLLQLLSAARNGLRESDIAELLGPFIGRMCSSLVFADTRRFLGRYLGQNECGEWGFRCNVFNETVMQMLLGAEDLRRAWLVLGDFCAALSDTDSKRADAAWYYVKAGAIERMALLLGDYAGDPMFPDVRRPWLEQAAFIIARDICAADRGSRNPVAEWFGHVLVTQNVSPIVTFRLCERTLTMIFPQLAFAAITTRLHVLMECYQALTGLLGKVPDTAKPIDILWIGDDSIVEGGAAAIGAKTLETGEAAMLDTARVTELLEYVRRQAEYMRAICELGERS